MKKLKPKEAYPYYQLSARDGVYTSYAIKDTEKYIIEGEQVTELKNEQLPITAFRLSACGTQTEVEQSNHYGCENRADFFFDVIYEQKEQ